MSGSNSQTWGQVLFPASGDAWAFHRDTRLWFQDAHSVGLLWVPVLGCYLGSGMTIFHTVRHVRFLVKVSNSGLGNTPTHTQHLECGCRRKRTMLISNADWLSNLACDSMTPERRRACVFHLFETYPNSGFELFILVQGQVERHPANQEHQDGQEIPRCRRT